ncbi:MAG: hypothetical protein ACOC9Q_02840, partial [bacterium]
MLLEKFSRYFRRYDITFAPRHKGAAYLTLDAPAGEYSVRDALQRRKNADLAMTVQPNGDIVELMEVDYRPDDKALVLLFHRGSPNAADPAYRKRARAKAGTKVTVRDSVKEKGEEQSVSAHFIVYDSPVRQGVFRCVLEEVPGISMTVVRQCLGEAMAEYEYKFKRKKKIMPTYSVVKAEGVKSESMTDALKTGHANWVTLVRPATPDFVDADGVFEPVNEVMRLRITGNITSGNWKNRFSELFSRAKGDGWQEFNVDIELDDKRKRTIKLERDQEAKEILFVRSE